MPFIQVPISGLARPAACEKEVTADFVTRRSELSPDHMVALERLIESFNQRPQTHGDTEFPGTVIGTVHARIRPPVYVLYQQFNRDGEPRYLIKLWYCGTVTEGRLDFEDQYSEGDGA